MNLLKTEVGMLGSNTAIWIAYTLGGVALLVFIARLCAVISNKAVASQSQKID